MPVPPIIAFDELDSTNAEARRRAEAGERGPVWLTAALQTAGRGRRGRHWQTARGNLAATYLFTTDKSAGEAAQISFVAALAAWDLAARYVSSELITLKWPNDPMIGGRKVGGILVESGAVAGGGVWLAVGTGINLAHSPGISERPVTAIAQHMAGEPPTTVEAIEVLREAFAKWETCWLGEGFAAIARAWTAKAHGLGALCEARLPNETVAGVAEGLDIDGAFRLRTQDGAIRRITAGDVYFD